MKAPMEPAAMVELAGFVIHCQTYLDLWVDLYSLKLENSYLSFYEIENCLVFWRFEEVFEWEASAG
jgi:hypothetical protein